MPIRSFGHIFVAHLCGVDIILDQKSCSEIESIICTVQKTGYNMNSYYRLEHKHDIFHCRVAADAGYPTLEEYTSTLSSHGLIGIYIYKPFRSILDRLHSQHQPVKQVNKPSQ
jgi:hypothetical protein